ncbi:hypothetical protein PILCRDRAFT_58789 [Piloderma croceum F 1598]|uniref:Hydrophobin n=1 Tax=Piloderma croceum (strain F 1598) TaxID=765440 RepID=A0A0C3CNA3_PILCF|nr:hypothetical protein PILCRDRAFT_58789 [Piloderma croceum F 1598]
MLTCHSSQCNTGTQKCCNTVQSASSAAAGSSDLDLINALQSVAANLMVGLGCAPISVIPVGPSSQCAQQPVCCEGNDSTGLISLSCMPITA